MRNGWTWDRKRATSASTGRNLMTEKLAGKTVLVTGAGGFIGSHLAEGLVAQGAKTRALVRYNALGTWGWLDRSPVKQDIEIIAGDISDKGIRHALVKGCDVVFHLAALIAIPYSYRAPASYVPDQRGGHAFNVYAGLPREAGRGESTSTLRPARSMARLAPSPFARIILYRVSHPIRRAKSAPTRWPNRFICHLACRWSPCGLSTRSVHANPPRAVIPTIITQCLAGQTVHLGNLRPTRDLNFVSNTVEGFILAASSRKPLAKRSILAPAAKSALGIWRG